jgi:hypothetical protein
MLVNASNGRERELTTTDLWDGGNGINKLVGQRRKL